MIYSWKFYVIKYIYCGFIDVLLEGVANISAAAVHTLRSLPYNVAGWIKAEFFSISTKVLAGRLFKYIYLNFIVKSLTGK